MNQGLSTKFRLALMLSITLGALVSFGSAQSAAVSLSSDGDVPELSARVKSMFPNGDAVELALATQHRVLWRSIQAMGLWRLLPLLILASAASFVFVAALRIRWAAETPKASTGLLLANSAMVAAVTRTIVGAQDLQLSNRATQAYLSVLHEAHVTSAEMPGDVFQILMGGSNAALSLVVVTGFLVVWHYFRSPQVQALLGPDDVDND